MKVSCLMVTKPGREELAKQAIEGFYRQTYRNRELVVITTNQRSFDAVWAYHAAHERRLLGRDVPMIDVQCEEEAPLGALRNWALLRALGPVICQWDDDDLHHPERIQVQLDAMVSSGRHSSFFCNQCYQLPDGDTPYLQVVDWYVRPTAGSGHLIPGTLMCYRSALRYRDDERTGEDTHFLQAEIKANGPSAVVDRPGLYVRRFHDDNTTARAKALANLADRSWDGARLLPRLDQLRGDLSGLSWALGCRVEVRAAVGDGVYTPLDARRFILDLARAECR
jgi:glycosyltransferase involved in cell wall biosynthesis